MLSVVVPALFGFFCLLALGAVTVTLREYGPSLLALRKEIGVGTPRTTVSYRIVDTRRSADVVAFPVSARQHPAKSPALSAAA